MAHQETLLILMFLSRPPECQYFGPLSLEILQMNWLLSLARPIAPETDAESVKIGRLGIPPVSGLQRSASERQSARRGSLPEIRSHSWKHSLESGILRLVTEHWERERAWWARRLDALIEKWR